MASSNIISKGKDRNGVSVWEIQVSTGVKVNGRYQRHTETFHGTLKQAKTRRAQIRIDLANGIDTRGGKTPFDQYAKSWLSDKSKTVAPRTLIGYTREVERLCGIIGATPLEKINAKVVRDTVEVIRASIKGRNGEPSESSVKATYTVLYGILGRAEKDDLIRRNPCTKIDPPKADHSERRSMTAEQYQRLIVLISESISAEISAFQAKENHLTETGHQNKERHALRGIHTLSYLQGIGILHATGLRPSELLALQWRHIDFDDCCIHVEQATETAEGGAKSTKSHAGKRDVYLNASTLEGLRKWRIFQMQAANKLGIELGQNSWVVCSDTFSQVHHQNMNHWWNRWAAANGFEGWQMYELRHTQVTLLLDAGANVKTVQTRLGHSSAAVTLGVYAHALESSQREAAELLPSLA